MVLTGRAALEISGAVSAEDEVGIGGYERIMGPAGQAHYQARDIADAYEILLGHYACSYRAPGEPGPRRFATRDRSDRDVTESRFAREEGFESVAEIFSDDANPGRKRPFPDGKPGDDPGGRRPDNLSGISRNRQGVVQSFRLYRTGSAGEISYRGNRPGSRT